MRLLKLPKGKYSVYYQTCSGNSESFDVDNLHHMRQVSGDVFLNPRHIVNISDYTVNYQSCVRIILDNGLFYIITKYSCISAPLTAESLLDSMTSTEENDD